MAEKFGLIVGKEDLGLRLDLFLKEKLEKYSRSQIQRWILQKAVLCDGASLKPSAHLEEGQRIEGSIPEEEISLVAEPIGLNILYEDQELLVVVKPSGMVAHPSRGNFTGTLANALAFHLKSSKEKDLAKNFRLGLVHRLDRDTSGLLVVAKNAAALESLSVQFKEREIEKIYRAIVCGSVKEEQGEIESPIGRLYRSSKMGVLPAGKYSLTSFKVLKRFGRYSYLEVRPKTGRTHQIRVHLAKIGHPIVGDLIYGKEKSDVRLMLHAYQLEFEHPTSGKRMKFTAPLPPDFQTFLKSKHQ